MEEKEENNLSMQIDLGIELALWLVYLYSFSTYCMPDPEIEVMSKIV